jgi:N-acyl homoserine lactone hydrolase
MDHAGNHDAFRKAELIVQRKHYELARSGHPRLAAARAHWHHRLPETGPVLLAIDAVMMKRTFTAERMAE